MFVHSRVQVSGEARSLRRSGGLRFLFVLVVLVGSQATAALAGVGGSISGTVTDPSGAVVAGAPVTATNTGTGVVATARTDGSGFYSFPELPIGDYDVEVKQPGFKSYRKSRIHVDANSAIRADIRLDVGQVSESVTVSTNAVQVETQSTQMGEVGLLARCVYDDKEPILDPRGHQIVEDAALFV